MRTARAIILVLFTVSSLSATEYVFQNFDIFLRDRLGITWATQLDVSIGVFDAGFTPTLENYSTWNTKFTTDPSPGYYVGPAGGGPEYSAALRLSDNLTIPVGSQLRLWIRTPAGFGGAAQTALFTDSSWLTVSNSPTDVVTRYFDFSNVTTAVFGTFDFNNNQANTVEVTAVPEPSSYALGVALPALALAAFARRRRMARKP
jgi:hypothetical protein